MTFISRRIWGACALAIALATLAPAQTGRKITTPKEALGFEIGDDYYLANYTQLTAWWQKLAKESDRVKLVEIGKSEEGRPQWMAIITSPENHRKLARYKEIARKLALAVGLTGDAAHARRKGYRLDRRRVACHRGSRRRSVDGIRLRNAEPQRSGDAAHSRRRRHPRRACQPRWNGAGFELVHARIRSQEAHHAGRPAIVAEVYRTRQQSRFLHVQHERIGEQEPRAVHGVVSADHVQPSPDRSRRRGDVRSALPRSLQLQFRPADPVADRNGGLGHAQPHGGGRKARHHHAQWRALLDLVQRRPAHHDVLP